jgi:hypothetical protein
MWVPSPHTRSPEPERRHRRQAAQPPTPAREDAVAVTLQSLRPVSGGLCPAPTETLGTGVAWDRNPVTAFQRASQEDKLVFLLHLSGNFDTPDET